MKKKILILAFCLGSMCAAAQEQRMDTLVISRQEAEVVFLEKNLRLIAAQLDIDEAKAEVIQAKLWPNPSISINEVNLWSNRTSERMPNLIGQWGNTAQVGVEIEQLIQTAGKRKKMVAMEQVGVEMAAQYFEDLLLSLKVEFRNNLTNLQYIQSQLGIYRQQLENMRLLLGGYQNQYEAGNVSRSEYLRLKASELEFTSEIRQLKITEHELQKELKTLMGLSAHQFISITDAGFVPDLHTIASVKLQPLLEMAIAERPDLKIAALQNEYLTHKLSYEKALKTPDIAISANYDRGGNIMMDFVGVGIAMDIPIFNKNQGNIRAAHIALERNGVYREEKNIEVQSQVVQVYQNLMATFHHYQEIDEGYEGDLQVLLESHHRNFANRNISILEYLDFLEAYIGSMGSILTTKKELNTYLEELQYQIGINL